MSRGIFAWPQVTVSVPGPGPVGVPIPSFNARLGEITSAQSLDVFDTSLNATSVAWDFKNDGSVESTNSTVTISGATLGVGNHALKLTATNANGPAALTVNDWIVVTADASVTLAPPIAATPHTPPAGTALTTVYSEGTANDYVSWGQPFPTGDLTEARLAKLFLYDGSNTISVQADNTLTWPAGRGGGARWARLSAKLPAGYVANNKLTLFYNDAGSHPAVPTYTMTDDFEIEFSGYRQAAGTFQINQSGESLFGAAAIGDVITLTLSDGGVNPQETFTHTIVADEYVRDMMGAFLDNIENSSTTAYRIRPVRLSDTRMTVSHAGTAALPGLGYGCKLPVFHKPLAPGANPVAAVNVSFTVARAGGSTYTLLNASTVRTAIARKTYKVAWNDLATKLVWRNGHQVKEEWRVGAPTALDATKMDGLRVWMSVSKDRDGNVIDRQIIVMNSDMFNANTKDWQYDVSVKVGGVTQVSVSDLAHGQFQAWTWPFSVPRKVTVCDRDYLFASEMVQEWNTPRAISVRDQFTYLAGNARGYAAAMPTLSQYSTNPHRSPYYPASEANYPLRFTQVDYGGGTAGGGSFYGLIDGTCEGSITTWTYATLAGMFNHCRNGLLTWRHWGQDEVTADSAHLNGVVDTYAKYRVEYTAYDTQISWVNNRTGIYDLPGSYIYIKPSHFGLPSLIPYIMTGQYLNILALEQQIHTGIHADRWQYGRAPGTNTTYSVNGVYFSRAGVGNGPRARMLDGSIMWLSALLPATWPRRAFWTNFANNVIDAAVKSMGHHDLGILSNAVIVTENGTATEIAPTRGGYINHTKGNPLPAADGYAEQSWQLWQPNFRFFGAYAAGASGLDDVIAEMSKAVQVGWADPAGKYERGGYIAFSLCADIDAPAGTAVITQDWETALADWNTTNVASGDFNPINWRAYDISQIGTSQPHNYPAVWTAFLGQVAKWGVEPYKTRAATMHAYMLALLPTQRQYWMAGYDIKVV